MILSDRAERAIATMHAALWYIGKASCLITLGIALSLYAAAHHQDASGVVAICSVPFLLAIGFDLIEGRIGGRTR